MTHEEVGMWLQALRSGRYSQGQSCLITSAGGEVRYCCLGVLSAVFLVYDPDSHSGRQGDSDVLAYPSSYRAPFQFLRLQDAAGRALPPVTRGSLEDLLVSLNDKGPIDSYRRVIADIEGALETYITR